MLVDDMVTLFAAQGLGTAGTTLFGGLMPATPDTCTVFTESGGITPTRAFGQGLPIIEYPRVQIRTRGPADDHEAARLRCERAYQMLVQRGAEVISGGARYMCWVPIQMPFPLEQDANRRWVFAVNFEVWKEVSALP
jgi:hypothetical protein